MSKTQAIDRIRSKLDALTDEQAEALAEIAEAYARDVPTEDTQTLAAIAEGVRQAATGQRVAQAEMDLLIKTPWR